MSRFNQQQAGSMRRLTGAVMSLLFLMGQVLPQERVWAAEFAMTASQQPVPVTQDAPAVSTVPGAPDISDGSTTAWLASGPLTLPAVQPQPVVTNVVQKVASIPEGWAPISTNANFAYRVVDDSQKPGFKRLEILNLKDQFSFEERSIEIEKNFKNIDVSLDGKYVRYSLTGPQGNSLGVAYNPVLQKKDLIAAVSNSNFFFAKRTVGGYGLQLYLYDAQKKQAVQIAFSSIESYGDQVFNKRDVSPDGEFVVFDDGRGVQIQKINNLNEKLILAIEYGLASMTWTTLESGDKGVILKNLGGSRVFLVNLRTLQVTQYLIRPQLGWTLTPSNPDFAYRTVVFSNNSSYTTLEIVNLKTGQMYRDFMSTLTTNSFKDVDVSASGLSSTFKIVNAAGAILESMYFDLIEQRVWTFAKSNPNFIFGGVVDNPNLRSLILRNLTTGETQTLAGHSVGRFGDHVFRVKDVSPDGNYVVFDNGGSNVRLQKINNPNENFNLGLEYGVASMTWTILESGDKGVILKNLGGSGTKTVNLRTLKVVYAEYNPVSYYRAQTWYDSNGVIMRTLNITRDYVTKKVTASDETQYTSGVKAARYYETYDARGVKTRALIETFYANGVTLKTSSDERFESGIKKLLTTVSYSAAGVKIHMIELVYYLNGRIQQKKQYDYTQGRVCTTNYSSNGRQTSGSCKAI